jgi:hypothetical protein
MECGVSGMTDIDGLIYQKYPDCCYRSLEYCDLSIMKPLFTLQHAGYKEIAYISDNHAEYTVLIKKD